MAKTLAPKVLAIDDDQVFLQILAAAVQYFGGEIHVTTQPNEFLAQAKALEPAVCLIDLQLDTSSGFELIQALRTRDPRVAIIVISGVEERSAVVHALEIGADDFILKPLDRRLLATKLRRFINTAPLSEQRSPTVVAPGGKVDGIATLEAKVLEVDELGLHLASRNLIPKGVVVRVPNLVLPGLQLPRSELLLTITRTEFDAASGRYFSYGEFDGVEPEFLQAVRTWIIGNVG